MTYLEQHYSGYDSPPPLARVREFFEKQDRIEQASYLDEVKKAYVCIRSNYRSICDSERERAQQYTLQRVLRNAANINEHGIAEGKRTYRGPAAALEYISSHLPDFDRRIGQDSAASAFDALADFETRPRLATGVAAIDDALRGGLPAPRLVVLAGAPGAGKTSLAVAWANRWMAEEHPVGFMAVDEGRVGVVRRLCLMRGLQVPKSRPAPLSDEQRAFAEGFLARLGRKPDPTVVAKNVIAALPAIFREEGTVEQAVSALRRFAEVRGLERTPVLVVDSLQRVQATGSGDAPDPRGRVDAVIHALKSAVKQGVMVVATSELSRAAYRHKSEVENIADIAAAKESGAIEYAAETLLVLRVKDEQIRVSVPKNRGRAIEPFSLKLDTSTMSFEQVNVADVNLSEVVAIVREIVAKGTIKTVRDLYAACSADGRVGKHDVIDDARAFLERSGMLVKKDGVYTIVEPKPEDLLR